MTDKIILKKNARQRLELTNKDLQLLKFLEQQRLLTLQQFYQAATHLFKMKVKEYSFKNRIRKFEDYHLIRSEQYNEGFEGERFKLLCIGSKGIDLLIENKQLDQDYNKSKIYKFNQKKYLLHFLATQQAVINILSTFDAKQIVYPNTGEIKYPILYNVTSFSHSPSTFPYTKWIRKDRNLHRQNGGAYHARIAKYMTGNASGSEIKGTTMTIVMPDWIVQLKGKKGTKNTFINIELDMGTEPIETLIQKVFKYAFLAEDNPEQLHIMDIVIVDNSFSNRSKFSNGVERTKNIVNRFMADPAVVKRIKESGIKVIVRPLRLNVKKVYDLLCKY